MTHDHLAHHIEDGQCVYGCDHHDPGDPTPASSPPDDDTTLAAIIGRHRITITHDTPTAAATIRATEQAFATARIALQQLHLLLDTATPTAIVRTVLDADLQHDLIGVNAAREVHNLLNHTMNAATNLQAADTALDQGQQILTQLTVKTTD